MRSTVRVGIVALLAMCLCPALALAQQGTISGKVTSGATNLAGIKVQAISSSGSPLGTPATTDVNGDYTLTLNPGSYFIRTFGTVAQPGHINKIYPNNSCGTGCNTTGATAQMVVPAGALTNRNFNLLQGARISGIVTAGGLPQNGVPVQILVPGANPSSADVLVTSVTTNALGEFITLDGLLPNFPVFFARTLVVGGFLINEVWDDVPCPAIFCKASEAGQPIEVGAAGTTTGNINFDLTIGGGITGTVTRQSDGSPVFCASQCSVAILDAMGEFVGQGQMATNTGVFTVSPIPPGTYYAATQTAANLQLLNEVYDNIICAGFCDPTTGTPIVVTAGNTTANIDFQLGQSGSIAGTVTRAAGGTPVFCGSSCGILVVDASGDIAAVTTLTSSGTYLVSSLVPGTYYVRTLASAATPSLVDEVYDNLPCIGFCNATDGTPIVVTSGSAITGIDFQLVASAGISGTITNAATNAPLQGVSVVIWNSVGNFVTQVTSNSSGVFQTTGSLLAGTYYATTSNSLGFLNEVWDDLQCGVSCEATTGTPIVLGTGAQRNDINFALSLSGTITGTVTDTNGNALQGITVTVFNNGGGHQLSSTQTDSLGAYSLGGLVTGDYYLRALNTAGFINQVYNGVTCIGFCNAIDGTKVPVVSGATTANINFTLAPGGRISGTVTQPGGTPIADMLVSVYAGTTFVASGNTNASGVYLTGAGLLPGTYTVLTQGEQGDTGFVNELYDNVACVGCDVTTGTPVEVAAATTTAGINFELALGGTVTGRIVDDAATPAPLPFISVSLVDESGSFVGFAFTDADGTFSMPALVSGNYFLVTSNSDGYLDERYNNQPCLNCNPIAGTPIVVTAPGTTALGDISLAAGGRISGTVTADGGSPLSFVSVYIYDAAGALVTSGLSDSSGFYLSGAGLPTGTYFAATSNNLGYIDEVFNGVPAGPDLQCPSCIATTGAPIAVTLGTTTAGRDFSLALGGSISGTVTTGAAASATSSANDAVPAAGTPLANVSVTIYDFSGTEVSSAETNSQGVFVAHGLPSGTYYATTDNDNGYVDERYDNGRCQSSCTVIDGSQIQVTAGATTSGIDFDLVRGGQVAGIVTGPEGPLANVTISISDAENTVLTTGKTNNLGEYTSGGGLADGTYFARTSNSQGFLDEIYDNSGCPFCQTSTGTPISVTAGAITPAINFALVRGGRVSGVVTDADGHPLAGVSVEFTDAAGGPVGSGVTNVTGSYVSGAMPAGTFFARTSNEIGFVNETYNDIACAGSCSPATGEGIAVTLGATTPGINFSLARGGRIAGTVTGAGTPLVFVQVQIGDPVGNLVTTEFTDALGRYTTGPGLPAGVYYARVFNSDGFIDETYNNIACVGFCATGTPITVALNATTSGIDFDLAPGGRISGVVTDAATGVPLQGVSVNIGAVGVGAFTSGSTDAVGRYVSSGGLPSGKYVAWTSNELGYIEQSYNSLPCGNRCGGGTEFDVTIGQTTDHIDFSLARGSRVSGTVRRADTNAPLANVAVEILRIGESFPSVSALTDSSGHYLTAGGLIAGRYFARTTNAQGLLNAVSEEFEVTPPATASGIDLALGHGGQISGTISDAGGAGIPQMFVIIFDPSGAAVTFTKTTATGFYISPGLPAGVYYATTFNELGYVDKRYDDTVCVACDANLGTPITVAAGVATTGINFSLTRGGRVAGAATDAATGTPLAGVQVRLYTSNGLSIRETSTDSTGRYEMSGIAPGTYFAQTFNSLGYLDEAFNNVACHYHTTCPVTTGTPIPVAEDGLTPNINFGLVRGGTVSGMVTDNNSPPSPLVNASITLFDGVGREVETTQTDGLGRYTIERGTPAGTYYAVASAEAHLKELFGDLPCVPNCVVTDGTPIAVTLGATTPNINFTLARGGRIAGRITDAASGTPLSGVTLLVYTPDGMTTAAFAYTDGSGRYTTYEGLAPGNYLVKTSNSAGRIDEAYDNVICMGPAAACTNATSVAVGTATTPNIDFALAPGGRISGTVRDAASGAPLAGAVLFLYDSAGTDMNQQASTDLEGRYSMAIGLADGQYFLSTLTGRGLIDEAYADTVCVELTCDLTLTTPITISGGASVSGIDFALQRGGQIAGQVRGNSGGAIVPLGGVNVRLYAANGLHLATVATDAGGYYVISSGLPDGNYFVKTENTLGYVDQLFDNQTCVDCPVLSGTPVAVSAGEITDGISFVLQTGSLLNGTVFDDTTGQPLPGTFVLIRGGDGEVVATTTTNENGVYSISLPPGTYYVQTGANNGYTTTIYSAAGAARPEQHARPSSAPTPASVCPLGVCDVAQGTALVLASGSATGRIDMGIVPCGAMTISPATLPNSIVGADYSQLLSVTGGTAPYRFSISSGALPAGFSMDADTGMILGTTNINGYSSFTLAVSDQLGCSAASALTITITGTFVPPPAPPPPAPPAPTFVVTPGDVSAPARGVSATVQVTANVADAAWQAAANVPWITFSSAGGAGTGEVTLIIARNNTLVPRLGTASVAGQTITVSQRENGVPGTPQNLAAAVTSFRARFSWSAPIEGGDAASYRLEIGRAAGATELTFAAPTPAFELPVLPAGRYFARVFAINEFGVSIASQEHEILVRANGASPPTAPVNLRALVSGGVLTLLWDPPIGGNAPDGYIVEAGTAPGLEDIGELPVGGLVFTYAGLPIGAFHIRVRGVTALAGEGPASREIIVTVGNVAARPGVPIGLTYSVAGGSVVLTWQAPIDGGAPAAYVIEVGRAPGASDIGSVDTIVPVTAVRFDNAPAGVYWVRVRGRNPQGAGGATADIRVVVP